MTPALGILLSPLYDGALASEHRRDLEQSGLSPDTIARHALRSVPPSMIRSLLGFEAPSIRSAYLLPFPDPRGGRWLDHIRLKVFPPFTDRQGRTVKYLQPRHSGVRIFFPLTTLAAVRHSLEPIYFVEGEKKALAVAQTGLAAVGLCGIEGWHAAGATTLHPDLDDIGLAGRVVYLIPDADHRTNPAVGRAVAGLVSACAARRAAAVRIVQVPADCNGVDDFLVRR